MTILSLNIISNKFRESNKLEFLKTWMVEFKNKSLSIIKTR